MEQDGNEYKLIHERINHIKPDKYYYGCSN